MFYLVLKVLHNKSVNAIVSSCIYKLFQNSNYEIGDFFMMKVLHKIMPLSFNAQLSQMFGLQLQYLHLLTIHLINFLFNARCTLYMDLNNLVFLQIKFKNFICRYLYIHSFPMQMGYIHGT
jgi:hypothetical protein